MFIVLIIKEQGLIPVSQSECYHVLFYLSIWRTQAPHRYIIKKEKCILVVLDNWRCFPLKLQQTSVKTKHELLSQWAVTGRAIVCVALGTGLLSSWWQRASFQNPDLFIPEIYHCQYTLKNKVPCPCIWENHLVYFQENVIKYQSLNNHSFFFLNESVVL